MRHETKIIREFEADIQSVFDAFSTPEQFEKWYGPNGFQTKIQLFEFKEGGKWQYSMHGPNDMIYPLKGKFSKIEAPNLIIMTDGWGDSDKKPGPTFEFYFEELGAKKTKLTLISVHDSSEEKEQYEKMGATSGWNSSFDRLSEFFSNK